MHQQACSDHFSISMSDSQLGASPEQHLRISVPRSIHSPAPVTPAAQLTHCAQRSTVFTHYAAAALQQSRAPPIQAKSCKCDAQSSQTSLNPVCSRHVKPTSCGPVCTTTLWTEPASASRPGFIRVAIHARRQDTRRFHQMSYKMCVTWHISVQKLSQ